MFLQLCRRCTTDDNGKKLDGHINKKDYLTFKKVWNEFNLKKYG